MDRKRNGQKTEMIIKLNSTLQHILWTLVTDVFVLVSFFFVYRVIAYRLGADALGAYSLVRTVTSFLIPVLILGFWAGIPRYLAMTSDKYKRASYFKSGSFVVIVFTCIFLFFVNIFSGYSSIIFFGSEKYVGLIMPFSLFLAGSVLHTLNYAYFRGRLFVKLLNISQIITIAMIPLLATLIWYGNDVKKLLNFIGLITLVSAFFFFLSFIEENFIKVKLRDLIKSFKEIFYFSILRTPGNFAMMGILSLGPVIASHFVTMREVGFLSVSQTLLGVPSTILSPLATVLFPKMSEMVGKKDYCGIEKNTDVLIAVIFYIFIFATIQAVIFSDVLIMSWLGSKFYDAINITRITLLPMAFYAMFVGLSNILEATKVKPINTINSFLSLLIFLLISAPLLFFKIFSPIISLSIGFSTGLIFLGTMTYLSVRKIFPDGVKNDLVCLFWSLLIGIAFGLITLFLKKITEFNFLDFIFFEVFIWLLYFLVLWTIRKEWVKKICEMAINRI